MHYFNYKNIIRCALYGRADHKQASAAIERDLWPGPEITYYYDHQEIARRAINSEMLISFLRTGIEALKSGEKKDEELLEDFNTDLTNPSEIRQMMIRLAEGFILLCEDAPNSFEANFIKVGSESMDTEIPLVLCVWKDNAKSEYFMRMRSFGWRVIQLLAKMHGWVPQGTKAPNSSIWFEELAELSPSIKEWVGGYDWRVWQEASKNPEWSKSYAWNSWEEVCAEDAHNLAHALYAAIHDITRGLRHVDLFEAHECDENLVNCVAEDNGHQMPRVTDAAEFRRQTVQLLERFIEFCDGAAFLIG
jgi:hypothetical protein